MRRAQKATDAPGLKRLQDGWTRLAFLTSRLRRSLQPRWQSFRSEAQPEKICERILGMLSPGPDMRKTLLFFNHLDAPFFLGFLYDLLCDLGRNFVVVIEFHGIRTARAGDRVESRLI